MLEGIDVSEYQGTIDWSAVAGAGKSFAFIRTGDGSYRDKQFSANWLGAKNAGLIVGAYHFLRPGVDGAAQADICIQMSGGPGSGVLPITIDVETASDPISLSNLVQAFAAEVESQTGQSPIIYTAPGFWGPNVAPTGLEYRCPLWVANWGVESPTLPSGWSAWTFWQYSAHGTCAGVGGEVDLDRFNGALSDLQSLAGVTNLGQAAALLGLGVLGGIGLFEAQRHGMIPSWGAIKEKLTQKVRL
jgi:lysozyme